MDTGKLHDRHIRGGRVGVFSFSQKDVIWSGMTTRCLGLLFKTVLFHMIQVISPLFTHIIPINTHARTHTHLGILPYYSPFSSHPSLPSFTHFSSLPSLLTLSFPAPHFFPPSFLHPPSLYILYILVPSTPLFLPPFLSSIPLYFYLLLPLSSSFLFYYPAPISLLHSIIPPSLPALSSLLCHQLYIVTQTPPPL